MKNDFNFKIQNLMRSGIIQNINHDFTVTKATTVNNPQSHSIIFAKKIDEDFLAKIEELKGCLLMVFEDIELSKNVLLYNEVIKTKNPRLMFAKVMQFIIKEERKNMTYERLEGDVVVGENVQIGEDVLIEPFVFIDHGVKIGKNCVVKSGVKIRENVTIGKGCVISENAVIGGQGLGTEKDEATGRIYRIPHIGGVLIGDYVEIGALTAILSGTIEATIIGDFVFIDDLTHIAHNCKIGNGSMTAGPVEISGSAKIGRNCFIAPHTTIRNGIEIGDNCFVGQGAVVTKNIISNSSVAGSPADDIEKMKTWRKIQNKLLDEFEG